MNKLKIAIEITVTAAPMRQTKVIPEIPKRIPAKTGPIALAIA